MSKSPMDYYDPRFKLQPAASPLDAFLAEWKAKSAAATAGPWRVENGDKKYRRKFATIEGARLTVYQRDSGEDVFNVVDAAFIAHARNNGDRLVAALELALGRLRGHAESTLYDSEAEWARGVCAELDRLAAGGEG